MPLAQTRLETLQVCKLLQCVRDKDKTQIEKMTLHGVPHLINYNDASEGQTALSVAACANDDEMIDFLLSLGAHPDVLDFKGRSAAMRAAEYGHVDCLEKLAEKGANMKLTDREGKGILFYCISPTQRHAKCLEIAVVHGAEVNNMSKDGIPVLLNACETAMDNEDMVLLLLQKGAEPNAKQEVTPAEYDTVQRKVEALSFSSAKTRRRRKGTANVKTRNFKEARYDLLFIMHLAGGFKFWWSDSQHIRK